MPCDHGDGPSTAWLTDRLRAGSVQGCQDLLDRVGLEDEINGPIQFGLGSVQGARHRLLLELLPPPDRLIQDEEVLPGGFGLDSVAGGDDVNPSSPNDVH